RTHTPLKKHKELIRGRQKAVLKTTENPRTRGAGDIVEGGGGVAGAAGEGAPAVEGRRPRGPAGPAGLLEQPGGRLGRAVGPDLAVEHPALVGQLEPVPQARAPAEVVGVAPGHPVVEAPHIADAAL